MAGKKKKDIYIYIIYPKTSSDGLEGHETSLCPGLAWGEEPLVCHDRQWHQYGQRRNAPKEQQDAGVEPVFRKIALHMDVHYALNEDLL